MALDLIPRLANELGIRPQQAESAVRLLDEGNTVPFIARYRKEATGPFCPIALYLNKADCPRNPSRSRLAALFGTHCNNRKAIFRKGSVNPYEQN